MTNMSPKTMGILFAIIGFSCFAFTDVCLKIVSNGYSPFAVALYMNIFTSLFILPIIIYSGGFKKIISTKSVKFHAVRSYFMLINFLCIIYAFSKLPLATVYIIVFTMPFMLNILSIILLKEKISSYRWFAIIFGFIGVLIAMRPGFEPIILATAVAIFATLFNAMAAVTVRYIDKSDHWLSYTFFLMVFQTPVLMTIVLYQGGSLFPDLTDWVLMPWFLAGGLVYVVALSLTPQALQRIDISVIGSLIYIAFPWGVFYGYFIFKDVPDIWTLCGAAIIIASGLFLIYRERIEDSKILNANKYKRIKS